MQQTSSSAFSETDWNGFIDDLIQQRKEDLFKCLPQKLYAFLISLDKVSFNNGIRPCLNALGQFSPVKLYEENLRGVLQDFIQETECDEKEALLELIESFAVGTSNSKDKTPLIWWTDSETRVHSLQTPTKLVFPSITQEGVPRNAIESLENWIHEQFQSSNYSPVFRGNCRVGLIANTSGIGKSTLVKKVAESLRNSACMTVHYIAGRKSLSSLETTEIEVFQILNRRKSLDKNTVIIIDEFHYYKTSSLDLMESLGKFLIKTNPNDTPKAVIILVSTNISAYSILYQHQGLLVQSELLLFCNTLLHANLIAQHWDDSQKELRKIDPKKVNICSPEQMARASRPAFLAELNGGHSDYLQYHIRCILKMEAQNTDNEKLQLITQNEIAQAVCLLSGASASVTIEQEKPAFANMFSNPTVVTYGGFLSESRTKKFIIGNKNYDVFHLKPGGEPIICFPAAIALLSLVKKTRTTLESIRTVLGSPGMNDAEEVALRLFIVLNCVDLQTTLQTDTTSSEGVLPIIFGGIVPQMVPLPSFLGRLLDLTEVSLPDIVKSATIAVCGSVEQCGDQGDSDTHNMFGVMMSLSYSSMMLSATHNGCQGFDAYAGFKTGDGQIGFLMFEFKTGNQDLTREETLLGLCEKAFESDKLMEMEDKNQPLVFVALHPGMKDQKSRGTRTLALSGEEIDNRKKSGKEDNSKGKDGMKKQKNKNKQEKEGEKKGVQEAEKSGKDLKTKKKKILLTHGSSSPKEGQSPKTQHIDLILGGYVNRDNEFAEILLSPKKTPQLEQFYSNIGSVTTLEPPVNRFLI